jgi:ADP-ribose pyrophosphatase
MSRDMKWKTLSSQQLFTETWMNIRADTCERPDGAIVSPYYVYNFPDWVTAIAVTKDGRIILERQYRHAIGETGLEIPGGCVDKSDASLEAAIERELLEETGYRFDKIEYLGKTSSNTSTNSNLMYAFLATGGEKISGQDLDEGEDIEILLVTVDELVALVKAGKFLQSMHMVAVYLALEKMGRVTIQ